MKRLVWFVCLAFLAGILVAGCGKPEEPKKPAATQAAPEKKEAEKKEPEKKAPEKVEPEKKPEAEAPKMPEPKPKAD